MSPERTAFKELDEFITDNYHVFVQAQGLVDKAIQAFHEDHPEIKSIRFNGDVLLAYKGMCSPFDYTETSDEKLATCMKIFEGHLKRLHIDV